LRKIIHPGARQINAEGHPCEGHDQRDDKLDPDREIEPPVWVSRLDLLQSHWRVHRRSSFVRTGAVLQPGRGVNRTAVKAVFSTGPKWMSFRSLFGGSGVAVRSTVRGNPSDHQ